MYHHSSVGVKSVMGLTWLKSRHQKDCVLSGDSKGKSASMLIQVVGRIQFHAFVEMKSLFPCCLSLRDIPSFQRRLSVCKDLLPPSSKLARKIGTLSASSSATPLSILTSFAILSSHITVPNINHISDAPFTM